MASLRLVLIAALPICFCQLPANASQRRARALVTQITRDPATLSYTFRIRQGTPLQIQRIVLDIDQDYTAKLCKSYEFSGCGTCYGHGGPGCNNNTCVVPGLGSDSYELSQDVAALRSSDGSIPGPLVSFPHLAFSCGSKADLGGGAVGVAGMSSSNLALPAQFSAAAGFGHKFAMCLPGGNAPRALFFGDGPLLFLPPPARDLSLRLIRTPLIKIPGYVDDFYIGVQRIEANGVPLSMQVPKLRIGTQGLVMAKLSTVEPYTRLATPIYNSLVAVFTAQTNLRQVASVYPLDACFNSTGVASTRVGPAVPAIDLVLQRNATFWRIFGANSMVAVSDKVLCLGFVEKPFVEAQVLERFIPIVIGTYQMHDNLLQFDLPNSTLGFSSSLLLGQTTCSNFNFTSSS